MDLLIGDVFRNAARAVPHRLAVELGDDRLTFSELDRDANRLGRALGRLGVGHGDRVLVWSDTSLDVVALFAAVPKCGAVFAPINPGLSADEAAAMIRCARPALVAVDEARAALVHAAIGGSGSGGSGPGGSEPGGSEPGGSGPGALPIVTLAELGRLAAGEDDADLRVPALGEDDPHVVFFTSGSTGRPKGAVLSHRVNFLRTHPGALLEPRGALVCPYPLFHMGAWTLALQQWQARDAVVLVASADPATLCAAVERHRATRLNCIPAVWQRILDHLATPEGATSDLSSVRFADTGTSVTPPELLDAIASAIPDATIRVFYGSTEAGSVASLDAGAVAGKPGSCGVPGPSAEIRIDDHGELWVRGPLLFDGYFGDPEATAEALVDGWYRSGDMVDVDPDGYLTVIGRAGDVIRTGGETVAPAEVENVLGGCPTVADVAVVGLPDAQWGEIVCAVVVPRATEAPPSLEELRAHCEGHLARYKHPRRVAVVDVIPRTVATNQVQRRVLVQRLLA